MGYKNIYLIMTGCYNRCRQTLRQLCDNYTLFSAVAMNGERGRQQYYYNKSLRNAKITRINKPDTK